MAQAGPLPTSNAELAAAGQKVGGLAAFEAARQAANPDQLAAVRNGTLADPNLQLTPPVPAAGAAPMTLLFA